MKGDNVINLTPNVQQVDISISEIYDVVETYGVKPNIFVCEEFTDGSQYTNSNIIKPAKGEYRLIVKSKEEGSCFAFGLSTNNKKSGCLGYRVFDRGYCYDIPKKLWNLIAKSEYAHLLPKIVKTKNNQTRYIIIHDRGEYYGHLTNIETCIIAYKIGPRYNVYDLSSLEEFLLVRRGVSEENEVSATVEPTPISYNPNPSPLKIQNSDSNLDSNLDLGGLLDKSIIQLPVNGKNLDLILEVLLKILANTNYLPNIFGRVCLSNENELLILQKLGALEPLDNTEEEVESNIVEFPIKEVVEDKVCSAAKQNKLGKDFEHSSKHKGLDLRDGRFLTKLLKIVKDDLVGQTIPKYNAAYRLALAYMGEPFKHLEERTRDIVPDQDFIELKKDFLEHNKSLNDKINLDDCKRYFTVMFTLDENDNLMKLL